MDTRRQNLPRHVETDGEPRVPPLGPHKIGWEVDSVDGCAQMENRFDSGMDSGAGLDSFKSDSFFSEDDLMMDTLKQMETISLRDGSEQTPATQRRQFTPHTNLDSDDKTDSLFVASIDEGFGSGLPSGLSSLGTSSIPNQCTDHVVQPSPESTQIHDLQVQKAREIQIASIFSQDEDGDTQLHIAIIQGKDLLAEQMIRIVPHPEYLNISNNLHQTPLHLAVVTKQPLVVRRLIASGAALDARDRHGNTPLHLACRDGSMDCVEALTTPFSLQECQATTNWVALNTIPQPADIRNYDGETCLHLAAANHHMPVLAHLVGKAGFDINVKDGRSGRTVLHYAIDMGRAELVVLLVNSSCDVNARTFDGTTPLRLAAGRGLELAVKLLLDNGADYDQLNYDDSVSDISDSEEDMMEPPFYDDFVIGGQPISSR